MSGKQLIVVRLKEPLSVSNRAALSIGGMRHLGGALCRILQRHHDEGPRATRQSSAGIHLFQDLVQSWWVIGHAKPARARLFRALYR